MVGIFHGYVSHNQMVHDSPNKICVYKDIITNLIHECGPLSRYMIFDIWYLKSCCVYMNIYIYILGKLEYVTNLN